MSGSALRRLEGDLLTIANTPDDIDRDDLRLIARRLSAQAEMIDEGIVG